MQQSRRQFASTLPSSGQQYVTTADFHNRIERRRQEQGTLADMNQYRAADSLLRATAESEKRVETLRRVRGIQSRQQAVLADALFENELLRRDEQQKQRQEDEALAKAMHQLSVEQTAKLLTNRRICDESPELQELKHLLAAAATNKVRQTQLHEKHSMRQQEALRDREIAERMERDRLEALQVMKEQEELQLASNLQTRLAMQEQMRERLDRKKAAFEEGLREKAAIDQVVADILKEDMAKVEAARVRRAELQRGIQEYLQQREVWRQQERKRAEAELEEIKRYNELQQRRMEEMQARKHAASAQQDAMLQRMSEEIAAKKREQEEVEQLLMELYAEEAEQRAIEAIRQREEKVAQLRAEMISANELQKRMKAEREAQAAREDALFREQMMAKFAEDRRIEQMNAQRRRVEMERYRREVDSAVEERRRQREAQLAAELAEMERAREQEAQRLLVVEEERQRLLREHADLLSRSGLPRGIVQSEEDYRLLFGEAPPEREPRFGIKKREWVDYDQFR